ncbi:MAG: phosphoenolpyruvate--protein phosphotransferase [Lachnospira sp.]|nr:phosphoenolpyruvate--protein phosphotransferase [Lachnospira sp.]
MVENRLKGLGVTKKIGIGKAVKLTDSGVVIHKTRITDTEAEVCKFYKVRDLFIEETENLFKDLSQKLDNNEVALIIQSHIAIVNDSQFEEDIKTQIVENKMCLVWAVDVVCSSYIKMFSQIDNEVLSQRALDFEDIRNRLAVIINGNEKSSDNRITISVPNAVLVVKELHPSMTARMDATELLGIVVENGGETSHAAILAKALGIPTVLGVKGACELIEEGDTVVVDGDSGEVIVRPSQEQLKVSDEKRTHLIDSEKELTVYKDKETCTKDGVSVSLYANIGSEEEAVRVNEFNPDGIGLFRTEFLFMNGNNMPIMEEQLLAYKNAVLASGERILTIRTLDIGGDKEVPYLGLEREVNPFLGLRGIRLCLEKEAMFREQIEAILRASAYGCGNVRIMIPLVTNIEEIRAVKGIISSVKETLNATHTAYDENIKVGIMIETPAAVIMADAFAGEVDFFSIGTNDLTQYTMVVDRGNEKVAHLFDTFSPAVLRAIKHVVSVADAAGIEVSMCGEAAADAAMIPVLLGLGLRKFSVASSLILETRRNIASWDVESAIEIATKIMSETSVEEIRRYGSDL